MTDQTEVRLAGETAHAAQTAVPPEAGHSAAACQSLDVTAYSSEVVKAAPDAVISTDRDGRIAGWNPAAEGMFGYTEREALGQSLALLMPEGQWETHRQAWEKAPAAGQAGFAGKRVEMTGRRKDGREFPMEAALAAWTGQSGVYVTAIARDLTERKQLEARVLRAHRLECLSRLASGMAHDINNALTPIMMGAELLQASAVDEQERQLLATITSCTQRAAGVVRQVLTFARGIYGQRVSVEMGQLLQQVASAARAGFPPELRLQTTISPDLWPLTGDPAQLRELFLNLCANAREAMPAGGCLTLTAANLFLSEPLALPDVELAPGRYVLCQVSDQGRGIPPEALSRIFEPFFTTKGVGQGSGLGLSAVLGIVRGHGGGIQVQSELNSGATFRVYLPVEACPAAAPPPIPAPELPAHEGGLILVVEDEAPLRESAKFTLESHGYRVITADNGATGLAEYFKHRRDVKAVVTDTSMPVMDGMTMVRAMRQVDGRLPIISASGSGDAEQAAALRALRVNEVLAKPYSAQGLLGCVSGALRSASAPSTT